MEKEVHNKPLWKYSQRNITFNYDEENALWYIGGYILRQVKRKVETSKSSSKEELLAIIDSFLEDDCNDDESTIENDVEDAKLWLNSINRVKCSNDFYRAAELAINKSLPLKESHLGHPHRIATDTGSNPSVRDAWNSLILLPNAASTEDLKIQILTLYTKIRFHAFASKTVEHYKQEKSVNLQKTKSLRSKLNTQLS